MISRLFRSLAVALLPVLFAIAQCGVVYGYQGVAAALHLCNGDTFAGELLDCDELGNLSWQGAAFEAPFDFPLNAVSAVTFEAHGPRPHPKDAFCLELRGGDALFGNLVGLSDQQVQFDSSSFGMLHVERSAVQRISRCREGADLIYLGPNGLLEWKQNPADAWEQDAGRPFTSKDGASLVGEFGLPNQACVDFELSWTSPPDFTLDFGTSPSSKEHDTGIRLEVLDRHLVLCGETSQKADLVSLQQIAPGAGRCHFRVYLDQKHRRAIVFAADGKQLADLALGIIVADAGDCLRLVNHRGNIRLEQLSIVRWNGKPPHASQGAKSRLDRSNGTVVNGEIEKFDAATREFIVSDGEHKSQVPADSVEDILLPSADKPAASGLPKCGLRAICENGVRLSGNLRKMENGRLWLKRSGIVEPIGIDLSTLRSLVVLQDRKPIPELPGPRGLLLGDGVNSHGCLEASGPASGASCLAWRPYGSLAASPLKQDFSGRIVYHTPPPPPSPLPQDQNGAMQMRVVAPARIGVLGVVMNIFGGDSQPAATPQSPSFKGPTLHLRTGDTVPCKVDRIDERGVTFHSPQFDATFVPNDKVKAIELENRSVAMKIDVAKRDRLLTLPRSQRDDQPTQLIRSTEGDYLRGRLIEMDDKTLTIEVRQETRRIPRDHVASIIWLDKVPKKPTEKDKTPAEKDKPAPPNDKSMQPSSKATSLPANRVQSLRSDGSRLTFRADKLTGSTLQGTSDVLGACRLELSEVDRLLLGRAIEQDADALPYQHWKLQPAIEPKFVQAGANGASSGVESELVGKPAPEFELETLDGPKFHLNDKRKKIVVLDFWASWCGPCMQTLPLLVPAVAKYRDRDVVLLAVNLQDTPETIHATLSRLNLKVDVGLDRDGVVAEKYAAAAIPQTVIVDANGNVARLFVGGGPQAVTELCEALDAVLKSAADKAKLP